MSTIGCIGHCESCISKDRVFKRQLTRGEITNQLRVLLSCYHAKEFWVNPDTTLEIPFMCEGEPLTNLDNVIDAIDYVLSIPDLGHRTEFIISTIGLSKGLKQLLAKFKAGHNTPFFSQVRLHWSLLYADPRQRKARMPGTRNQDIFAVRDLFIAIAKETGKQIMVNYVLMEGVNDSEWHIKKLVNFLDPEYFEIKISELVEEAGSKEKKVYYEKAMKIAKFIQSMGYSWHYFTAKGVRIGGACGQTVPMDKTGLKELCEPP